MARYADKQCSPLRLTTAAGGRAVFKERKGDSFALLPRGESVPGLRSLVRILSQNLREKTEKGEPDTRVQTSRWLIVRQTNRHVHELTVLTVGPRFITAAVPTSRPGFPRVLCYHNVFSMFTVCAVRCSLGQRTRHSEPQPHVRSREFQGPCSPFVSLSSCMDPGGNAQARRGRAFVAQPPGRGQLHPSRDAMCVIQRFQHITMPHLPLRYLFSL